MSVFLYLEIASSLRGRIERGDFEHGKLPSERNLTEEYGVQRATVRRALKTLEQEGLIFRDVTRGTFASPRASRNGGYSASAIQQGGIALVLGRAEDTTAPGDIARGLAQVAHENGRFLVWFDTPATPGHAEAEAPEPADLLERGIAACAIWPQIPTSVERLRQLRQAMPVVTLDRRVPGFESDFVGIDDFDAGVQVTQHLLGLGHRRIGLAAVEPHVTTVQNRYRGWRSALEAAGISPGPRWTFQKNGDLSTADDPALALFLEGDDAPLTAVVCTNDTIAAYLYQFLQRTGRIPGIDVALTGFGNAFPVLLDALGLTTVAQPFEALGRAAGEILLGRLKEQTIQGGSREASREVELKVSLVVRRSCGAGRSAYA